MSAKPKRGIDPYRRALYAKIEIGKKELGLDDGTYRDLLAQRYGGKRSRKSLGNAQLVDLVEHFKTLGFRPKKTAPARAGKRPLADGPEIRKMRALWLSLYHLGVVTDPSEEALAGFARRVTGGKETGIAALAWVKGKAAFEVIEALKAWAARAGGVDWRPFQIRRKGIVETVHLPRASVINAQYQRLHDLGVLRIGDESALEPWIRDRLGLSGRWKVLDLEPADADRIIAAMGAQIRAAHAERGAT